MQQGLIDPRTIRSEDYSFKFLLLNHYSQTLNKIVECSQHPTPPQWYPARMSVEAIDSSISHYYDQDYADEVTRIKNRLSLIKEASRKEEYFELLHLWLKHISYRFTNFDIFPATKKAAYLTSEEEPDLYLKHLKAKQNK